MGAVSKKKGNGQKDHITRKYKLKSRKGVPINSWITTTSTDGKFSQVWS